MRSGLIVAILSVVTLVLASAAQAQTCEDQYKACVKRGHTPTECRTSTNKCLETGRWIGPAGGEYPVSKKK